MFIIPFFGLLGVAPKKTRATFGFFATVSLVALWLERYLLVMPSVTALPGPVFGGPEIGPTLLFLGLYLLAYALFARTFPMISPRLAEITLERERGHSARITAEFDHEEEPKDYVSPESDREADEGREAERVGDRLVEGMPSACPPDVIRLGSLSAVADSRSHLLRISAFSRRIIARRLSEGRSPVIASIRSPTCIAIGVAIGVGRRAPAESPRSGAESASAIAGGRGAGRRRWRGPRWCG